MAESLHAGATCAVVLLHPTAGRAPIAHQPARPGRKPAGVVTLHAARRRRAARVAAAAAIEQERSKLITEIAQRQRKREFLLGWIMGLEERLANLPASTATSTQDRRHG